MAKIRRRVTTSTWIDLDSIEGEVLTKTITGKMKVKFDKRTGVAPRGFRQEHAGVDADGKDIMNNFVSVEVDPVKVYAARLWLVEETIEQVKAEYDDGAGMVLNEEFFEVMVSDEVWDEWFEKAMDRTRQRNEEVEKNSPSSPGGLDLVKDSDS